MSSCAAGAGDLSPHAAICAPFAPSPVPSSRSLLCSSRSQSLVIKDVTVIDATGRAAQPHRTVIIHGDRIVAIVSSRNAHIPGGARSVDGSGKFLIPGLWDMHVHGASDARAPWSHLLFIANGVVGVRDMSGPADAHAWRTAQMSNPDPSPTVYLGSPIVDGPNPVWPDSLIVADEAARARSGR